MTEETAALRADVELLKLALQKQKVFRKRANEEQLPSILQTLQFYTRECTFASILHSRMYFRLNSTLASVLSLQFYIRLQFYTQFSAAPRGS